MTKVFGDKGGFKAGPAWTPPPPPPKRRSALTLLLLLLLVLAVVFLILEKTGTIANFFPSETPADSDK